MYRVGLQSSGLGIILYNKPEGKFGLAEFSKLVLKPLTASGMKVS